MTTQHEWMTPQEAADYLRVSLSQVYRLTQHGKLPAHHLGRSRRYRRQDLDAAMQPNGINPDA
jgi:excisionase family DNA binding protein